MDESPHLTVPQLAKRWHTTSQAIYLLRHRGKAPRGFKSGRNVLFPLALVEKFEAERLANDKPSTRMPLAAGLPVEASTPNAA
ncbi:helix-turn-helix transcriptional regulator [Streptomyces sp. CB01201]|uniref:helix-turn-helix transcriptional regulator n=1 Tax=Streptomyces sp. CB01201 TaxID=2020324 RepID=UPI001F3D3FC8|nr:helix-turn-helix domain-containing protein [Streptomyces sp. CB01201]